MERLLQDHLQRSLRGWLRGATVALLGLAAVGPLGGESYFFAIILIPLLHCLGFWAFLLLCSFPNPRSGDSALYIKRNYPEIWKRLRPFGDYSANTMASLAFVAGKYDDGSDQCLQDIKARIRGLAIIIVWPFLVTPICWMIAFLAYSVAGPR